MNVGAGEKNSVKWEEGSRGTHRKLEQKKGRRQKNKSVKGKPKKDGDKRGSGTTGFGLQGSIKRECSYWSGNHLLPGNGRNGERYSLMGHKRDANNFSADG